MTIEISVSPLFYYQTSIKRSPYKQIRPVNGLWSRILLKLSATDQEGEDWLLFNHLNTELRAEDISFAENGWKYEKLVKPWLSIHGGLFLLKSGKIFALQLEIN